MWSIGTGGSARRPTWPVAHGLPVIGEALHFRKRPFEFFGDLYKQYGPVVEVCLPGRRLLVLGGPEANLFFNQHSEVLSNREQWTPYSNELGAVPINMEDGARHFARRRFLGQYYTPRSLLMRLPEMVSLADRRFEPLRAGDRVAVVPLMRRVFNDQLGVLLTGAAPEGYHDDLAHFVATSLGAHIAHTLPSFVLKLPAYARAKRRVFELSEHLLELQRNRKNAGAEGNLVAGLLAALSDPVLVPDEQALRAAVLGPFIAGIHTAAATAVLALHAISRRPELLAKVQAEVDQVFEHGVPEPTALKGLVTLRHVVMETLRRYPITAAIQRTLVQDVDFEGYRIPAGRLVTIATSASHFLPRFYADPERFDIDRFAAPRQEHMAKGAFAPFGIGPHRCLGASLADQQILLVLSTLLRRIEPAPPPDEAPRMSFIPGPGPHLKNELVVRRVRHHDRAAPG